MAVRQYEMFCRLAPEAAPDDAAREGEIEFTETMLRRLGGNVEKVNRRGFEDVETQERIRRQVEKTYNFVIYFTLGPEKLEILKRNVAQHDGYFIDPLIIDLEDPDPSP